MDLDKLQEKLGGLSCYQIGVIICVSILPFGTSFMSQTAAFFSAVPKFRCFIPQLDNSTSTQYSQMTSDEISQLMIPDGEPCKRFDYNLSVCTENQSVSSLCLMTQTNKMIPCDHGFVYDHTYYERTTVSELVCGRVTLDSVANSLYFLGMLLGSGIVGILMDWFGRRITLVLTGSLVVAAGLAVSFSPSYEVYVAMRILVGMTAVPCYITYYTYVNEMSNTRRRVTVAIFANQITATSHALLPIFGMLIRDWRYLGVCVSLVPLPALFAFYFIPESPRWLIEKGRTREARRVVERYAKSHKTSLDEDDWRAAVKSEREKLKAAMAQTKYTTLDLFRSPMMRTVSFIVIYLWCCISMVFYGLILNVWRLSGHPHVNGILNGSVEVVSYVLLWATLSSIGIKLSCSFSIFLSGVCCLTTMFLNHFSHGNEDMIESSRWIAIAGKFFATMAYAAIYQYTAELYPTLARGTAMAMGSMAARIGTIILPFTLQLQESMPWLTQTIFGIMGIVGGLLSLLLPETSKVDLLPTFEQAEEFYRREMIISAFIQKRDLTSPAERSYTLDSLERSRDTKNVEFDEASGLVSNDYAKNTSHSVEA